MNARSRLRRQWFAASLGLLLLLPIWLALSVWFGDEGGFLRVAAGGAAASLAGAAFGLRWNRRWQQLGFALLAGAGVAALQQLGGAAPALLAVAGGAVGFFAGLQGATVGERMDKPMWLWYGLALYFVAAAVYPRLDALRDTVPALTVGGAVCLAIALFVSNGSFLRGASHAANPGKPVPAALRRHNRATMAVVLLLVAALTAAFGNAFGRLLYAALRWLFGLLPDEAPAEEPPMPETPPATMPEMLPVEETEPGLLTMILNMIGYTIAALAAAALLAGLVVWAYRHGGGMIRSLLSRLAAFLSRSGRAAEDAAYVDEESVVFSWESVGKRMKETWLGRLLARSRAERWEDQRSNAERVRFLYRRWLRAAVEGGYEPRRHLTPRETEADVAAWAAARPSGRGGGTASGGERTLVELYDRVRYGGASPLDADVERARRGIDGK